MSSATPSKTSPASNQEEEDEENRIPMADELEEGEEEILDSTSSAAGTPTGHGLDSLTSINILESDDLTSEEQEEKARLIAQVLELQNTLDDLSSRVDNVKEENLRLRSENQVLGQYIENLMAASSVFQPANGDAPHHPSSGSGLRGGNASGAKKK